jgi:His-Xaa-Ser system protein HxsD
MASLTRIAGEFGNELISQRIRLDLAEETRPVRELIVAQAFAEADLSARE